MIIFCGCVMPRKGHLSPNRAALSQSSQFPYEVYISVIQTWGHCSERCPKKEWICFGRRSATWTMVAALQMPDVTYINFVICWRDISCNTDYTLKPLWFKGRGGDSIYYSGNCNPRAKWMRSWYHVCPGPSCSTANKRSSSRDKLSGDAARLHGGYASGIE